MKKEIELLLDKAMRSLAAARLLCGSGDYDFAAARVYYSIFYFSEALLLKKGLSFSKHTSVISAIYKHYIKPGELDASFHKTLHRAFELRQEGDYLSSNMITKKAALELLATVEDEIKKAMGLLK